VLRAILPLVVGLLNTQLGTQEQTVITLPPNHHPPNSAVTSALREARKTGMINRGREPFSEFREAHGRHIVARPFH
jgi:hypothetical protein